MDRLLWMPYPVNSATHLTRRNTTNKDRLNLPVERMVNFTLPPHVEGVIVRKTITGRE
jgi:hypothetical protein